MSILADLEDPCVSCGQEMPRECMKAKRPCGHHCNHSWTHDKCCWCDRTFDAGDKPHEVGDQKEGQGST